MSIHLHGSWSVLIADVLTNVRVVFFLIS